MSETKRATDFLRPLGFVLLLGAISAEAAAQSLGSSAPVARRDGAHDFGWEIGTWRTHLRRLRNPLTKSATWVEYEGTTVVREVLGGRANLAELQVEGPAGRIEGVALRLYSPQTRQWRFHYANIADGELTTPLSGAFANGRGEFYADDTLNGRPIRVRFIISNIGRNVARFEQAFSGDGGRTWEVNWIATDTRVEAGSRPSK
jgi:hypothetical protein